MPQPTTNLNSYRKEIVQLFQNDVFTEDIVSHLLANYNIHVTSKIIKCRLNMWGIRKWVQRDDSSQLWARISALFFEFCASDNEMLFILKKKEYSISKWSLKNLWWKLELRWKISWFNWKKADQKLHEIVQEELDKELIKEYECGFLYHHFRNQMHLVSQ